jgi:hypothetical protein
MLDTVPIFILEISYFSVLLLTTLAASNLALPANHTTPWQQARKEGSKQEKKAAEHQFVE